MGLTSRIRRKLWSLLINEASGARHDLQSFRDREHYGAILRQPYAYGMLRAADVAMYCGKKAVTVIEFGVASGEGLLNMVELSHLIQSKTGVSFHIVGFDTGKGLPAIQGYKDHPEIFARGDFTTEDREALLRKLDGEAEMIWGDIADTVNPFVDSLSRWRPLVLSLLIPTSTQPRHMHFVALRNRLRNTIQPSAFILMTLASFFPTNGAESLQRFQNSTPNMH